LRIDPNGDVLTAGRNGARNGWQLLSGWELHRDELMFFDSTVGRVFTADLSYPTLGGHWSDLRRGGGWWCLPATGARAMEIAPSSEMPPLIPDRMATPWYPLQAIRAAKEGSAVACFTVNADGTISGPYLLDLSDEIFRNPILSALQRSRYAAWTGAIAARPGCRTYTFELESIYARP
jgi:hypothetical protein